MYYVNCVCIYMMHYSPVPKVVIEEDILNFGNLPCGKSTTAILHVKNCSDVTALLQVQYPPKPLFVKGNIVKVQCNDASSDISGVMHVYTCDVFVYGSVMFPETSLSPPAAAGDGQCVSCRPYMYQAASQLQSQDPCSFHPPQTCTTLQENCLPCTAPGIGFSVVT